MTFMALKYVLKVKFSQGLKYSKLYNENFTDFSFKILQ